jgi:phosphoglycerol transferase MdoB-like AlkP superfamily enzyme
MTLNEFLRTDSYKTYIAQVNYANTVMKELVEHIKKHNKPNTIIIIEGDHGFRHFTDSLNNPYCVPNFTAIYFPDKNYSKLYDTMTPVNIFRILFDQYFHQDFPLLKDQSTIVKDYYDSSTVVKDR